MEPTPLRVAAWRLAQFPIPAEAVSAAAPDVLPAIAGAPEVSPAVRLLAAERAWATGVLPIEILRALYREMVFSPEERAEPLSQGVGLETPLLRALLLQAVEAQTVPTLRGGAGRGRDRHRQGTGGRDAHGACARRAGADNCAGAGARLVQRRRRARPVGGRRQGCGGGLVRAGPRAGAARFRDGARRAAALADAASERRCRTADGGRLRRVAGVPGEGRRSRFPD